MSQKNLIKNECQFKISHQTICGKPALDKYCKKHSNVKCKAIKRRGGSLLGCKNGATYYCEVEECSVPHCDRHRCKRHDSYFG